MERKPQAVIVAWECVKFGHSGARCHFSPSCGPGIFPVMLLVAALKMLVQTHGASWLRGAASTLKREGGKSWFLPKHLAARRGIGLMSSLGFQVFFKLNLEKGKPDLLEHFQSMLGSCFSTTQVSELLQRGTEE